MRVLITGMLPHDSGKTTVALGLARELGRRFKTYYFKPVAGHSGWYQPETLGFSMETGILVGHDAYVVARELGLLGELRLVNPVDILTMPPDPLRHGGSARFYLSVLSDVVSQAVLVRVSRVTGRVDEYLVVRENIARLNSVTASVVEALIKRFSEAGNTVFRDATRSEIAGLLDSEDLYREVDAVYGLLNDYDIVLTESYNNSSAPTAASLDADVVLVAAPSKLLIYDGRRYKRAVEALSIGRRPWTVETPSVLEVLGKPFHSMDIPYTGGEGFNEFISRLSEFIIHNK